MSIHASRPFVDCYTCAHRDTDTCAGCEDADLYEFDEDLVEDELKEPLGEHVGETA